MILGCSSLQPNAFLSVYRGNGKFGSYGYLPKLDRTADFSLATRWSQSHPARSAANFRNGGKRWSRSQEAGNPKIDCD